MRYKEFIKQKLYKRCEENPLAMMPIIRPFMGFKFVYLVLI